MLHYRFVKIDRTFNYNELAEFGSQTSLSANKGVNQQVMRFTPFIAPKKFLGISCMVYCGTMSKILFLRIIQSY